VADSTHHGATPEDVRRAAAVGAEDTVVSTLRRNALRRAADGTLTSQPDYEARKQEFMRDLLVKGQTSGRAPDAAGMGMPSLTPEVSRERHSLMYPPPSSVRHRTAGARAADGSPRVNTRLPYGQMRDLAQRQAQSHDMGVLARIKLWLGGADHFRRYATVFVILLVLNSRRIYQLWTDTDAAVASSSIGVPAAARDSEVGSDQTSTIEHPTTSANTVGTAESGEL
jgi:hypothetical protein